MANKFQPIDYKDVEDLIPQLPLDEQDMILHLRNAILDTLPQVKEKLAYNVPFYYLKKRIAFIWPGSVPWGKSHLGIVSLGFTHGHRFMEQSIFPKTDHKVIRQLQFKDVSEIDLGLVKTLLIEAAEIDGLKDKR